eukprot:TRINITY_DN393_c0_g1_i14.p1 TRINITY_DN393_c0_g1~~TRINITY_DN393_c0_g1_i14.p1  ORF type:complete len:312 (+),score=59.38 TRINITY_DN393_c0_g1_i14:1143-2078(+)
MQPSLKRGATGLRKAGSETVKRAPRMMGNLFQTLGQQARNPHSEAHGRASTTSATTAPPGHPAVEFDPNATRQLVSAMRAGVRQQCVGGPFLRDAIRPVMNRITFEDIGLRQPSLSMMTTIGCMTLEETSEYTLCYFFVPPGATLPLHDHPNMDVVQKVLFGNLRVRGFDWVQPRGEYTSDITDGLAYEVYDRVFTSEDEAIQIEPDHGGVLHEISAVGDEVAGFLDCITPSYSPHVRDCTYFDISPRIAQAALRDVVSERALGEVSLPDGRTLEDLLFSSPHPLHLLSPDFSYFGPSMRGFRPPSLDWMR